MIVWSLTSFSTVFQLYSVGQCTYPLTSTPHIILSELMAAFPHNKCRNNGQRSERNESCRSNHHQSSERTMT